MSSIIKDRYCATLEGDFCVFLIGMRVNKPLLFHKWIPVFWWMTKMHIEINSRQRMGKDLGLLGCHMWFGRTTCQIQYWRSLDQLVSFSRSRVSSHWPAWQKFMKSIGTDGTVGIWHETYKCSPHSYESLYINMPPFGLGKVGNILPATGKYQTAKKRLTP